MVENLKPSYPAIQEMCRALRRMYYVRNFTQRVTENVHWTLMYYKRVDSRRTVTVQLWGDGEHRATHSIDGYSNTPPTYFTNLNGLWDAVQHEETRTDNQRLQQGKGKRGATRAARIAAAEAEAVYIITKEQTTREQQRQKQKPRRTGAPAK